MGNPNDGGPAFPHETYNGIPVPGSGMTLRDWFAGQALAGFLARSNDGSPSETALDAYDMADAMLAAREAS